MVICKKKKQNSSSHISLDLLLQKSGIMDSHYHDQNLLHTIMNLFAAGSETTSATLRWGLLFITKYPEIQGRCLQFVSVEQIKKGLSLDILQLGSKRS